MSFEMLRDEVRKHAKLVMVEFWVPGCDGRQSYLPSVLPHSAMLPNETSCDLPLFDCTSEDEVWRRGRRLSPLLQHLCRSYETVKL